MTTMRQRRKSEAVINSRLDKVELTVSQIQNNLRWQTAIGSYLAVVITTIGYKIIFGG